MSDDQHNSHGDENSSFQKIQEWHVVLGDPQRRANRTTPATQLLVDVKAKWKEQNKGQKKDAWIPMAIQDFHQRLLELFSRRNYAEIVPDVDLGCVLIKCTKQARERIGMPSVYGYQGDTKAGFGTAKNDNEAIAFYFKSRDSPSLDKELERHCANLANLAKQDRQPPAELVQDFRQTLSFFQAKLEAADQGNKMAEKLLESLHPINALQGQWKHMQEEVEWVSAFSRWKEVCNDKPLVRSFACYRMAASINEMAQEIKRNDGTEEKKGGEETERQQHHVEDAQVPNDGPCMAHRRPSSQQTSFLPFETSYLSKTSNLSGGSSTHHCQPAQKLLKKSTSDFSPQRRGSHQTSRSIGSNTLSDLFLGIDQINDDTSFLSRMSATGSNSTFSIESGRDLSQLLQHQQQQQQRHRPRGLLIRRRSMSYHFSENRPRGVDGEPSSSVSSLLVSSFHTFDTNDRSWLRGEGGSCAWADRIALDEDAVEESKEQYSPLEF